MAESFARLLKHHRVAAGLSQEKLAERAGVSVEAISALERGVRHAPQKATLDLLIGALALDDDARREIEDAANLARPRGAQTPRHDFSRNLPRTITPLVDRVDDVHAVLSLLERYPLVTITGSGGVGKTRVAVAVGEQYAEQKSREVAFVDFSPLADGSLVVDAVATVVGAAQARESHRADALLRYLRNRTSLLIFDNCEHLLDDVVALARAILQACPAVVLLATSRERLDITGEALFRLPSLEFPSDEWTMVKSDSSYSALELFAERARAVDSRFTLTDESATLVADICRRLEGIPLAIELAAARLPVFGLATLQTRVSERFILTSTGRGVPSRQATMQATIAWSYDLLHEAQRMLLNRLAIFVGGFTLEAAERVCPGEQLQLGEIASLLALLVEKSLVNTLFDTEPIRYTLLDSVRAFALEQLAITDNPDAVSRRHALWLAEKSELLRQSGRYDIEPFLPELGNIRAALQWALLSADEQDILTAGRIAGGFRQVWTSTHRLREFRFWSESLIERIDEQRYPKVVAPLLAGLVQASDGDAAAAAIKRAIPLFERIGDYAGVAHLHGEFSHFLWLRGRYEQAEMVAGDALRICEMHGLERSDAFVHSLGELAYSVGLQRRIDEARAYITRALSHSDRYWRPWLISILGETEFCEGNTAKALELTEDALRQYPADTRIMRALAGIGSRLSAYHLLLNHLDVAAEVARENVAEAHEHVEVVGSMQHLAAIAALRGDAVAAARVLGFLDEWYTQTENRRVPIEQATYDVLIRALRDRLTEAAIDRWRTEGRRMTFDQAIDEVLHLIQAPAC